MLRRCIERCIDRADDRSVLAGSVCHEEAACVRASGLRPLTQERHEVREVVRDEDPFVAGCVREHVLIGKRRQLRIAIESDYVMASALELTAHSSARHMRVEQKPHGYFLSARSAATNG